MLIKIYLFQSQFVLIANGKLCFCCKHYFNIECLSSKYLFKIGKYHFNWSCIPNAECRMPTHRNISKMCGCFCGNVCIIHLIVIAVITCWATVSLWLWLWNLNQNLYMRYHWLASVLGSSLVFTAFSIRIHTHDMIHDLWCHSTK